MRTRPAARLAAKSSTSRNPPRSPGGFRLASLAVDLTLQLRACVTHVGGHLSTDPVDGAHVIAEHRHIRRDGPNRPRTQAHHAALTSWAAPRVIRAAQPPVAASAPNTPYGAPPRTGNRQPKPHRTAGLRAARDREPVGVAEAEQVAAPHDGHPALP